VNHYPRHIGDWIRDTAHLSEVEECIYSRMVDQYYAREKALPADRAQVCRLVRATTREARKAVDTVLEEFFAAEPDGWHQKRCDEELAKYAEKSAKASKSAAARWGKSDANGHANASPNAERTQSEGNASHKPLASNHEPKETSSASDLTTVAPATAESAAPPAGAEVRELPKPDRATLIAIYLRKQHIAIQAAHPLAQQWAAQGVTDDHLAEAVAIARMRKPTGPVAPNYLAPIVAEAREPRRDAAGKTLSQLLAERDAEEAAEAARLAATGSAHASH